MNIEALNQRQLCQKFVGGALATVTFNVIQGGYVPLLGKGGTGIGGQGNQITQVTGVTHRGTDALIRQQAADNQIFDTEIAQYIVNVGGDENARRRLLKHDFITDWFDHVKNPGVE